MPIYNGDIIDDYLRFRVDNRKFCWQKGAGRFEIEYLFLSSLLLLHPGPGVSLSRQSKLSLFLRENAIIMCVRLDPGVTRKHFERRVRRGKFKIVSMSG